MTAAQPCTCGHDWAAHGPTGCFACECPREEQPCSICQGSDLRCRECSMYWETRHQVLHDLLTDPIERVDEHLAVLAPPDVEVTEHEDFSLHSVPPRVGSPTRSDAPAPWTG